METKLFQTTFCLVSLELAGIVSVMDICRMH
jgi:hypothetical protein